MTWEELWGDAPWPSRVFGFQINRFVDVTTLGRELSRWAAEAVEAGRTYPDLDAFVDAFPGCKRGDSPSP